MPLIALIGRPNVGKSTLFNRLIRANRAITHDRPGVTRDRMYGEMRHGGRRARVVDTGGVTLEASGEAGEGPAESRGFEREILAQARLAVAEADVLALVLDAKEGLSPLDERLAVFLRESNRPVIALVNKVDGPEHEAALLGEFYALGLDLLAFSAAHGHNINTVRDTLLDLAGVEESEVGGLDESEAEEGFEAELETEPEPAAPEGPDGQDGEGGDDDTALEPELDEATRKKVGLRIAMLGRPNAGKSSLVNRLIKADRMIVSEIAGTTRDSVDMTFEHEGRRYTFVDTAGVRKKTRITDQVERYSVNAALGTARRADIMVVVLDATRGVGTQDKRLVRYLDERKIPFIVCLNKADLAPKEALKGLEQDVKDELSFCRYAPHVTVSAVTGRGLNRLWGLWDDLWEECGLRVGTGQLNRAMREVLDKHQAPVIKRVRAKFYYMTQAKTRPPTFIFFVNDPERVKPSYAKYVESALRKLFGMKLAPLRLIFRASRDTQARK